MHMVTETRQLRDGEKLTEFYNRIDWKPLFEFVQRYYGIGVEQPPVPCLKPNGHIEVNWPENLRDKCGLFCPYVLRSISADILVLLLPRHHLRQGHCR